MIITNINKTQCLDNKLMKIGPYNSDFHLFGENTSLKGNLANMKNISKISNYKRYLRVTKMKK